MCSSPGVHISVPLLVKCMSSSWSWLKVCLQSNLNELFSELELSSRPKFTKSCNILKYATDGCDILKYQEMMLHSYQWNWCEYVTAGWNILEYVTFFLWIWAFKKNRIWRIIHFLGIHIIYNERQIMTEVFMSWRRTILLWSGSEPMVRHYCASVACY